MMKTWVLMMLTLILGAACEESPRPVDEGNGLGDSDGNNNNNNGGSDIDTSQQIGNDNCESKLVGIIRDFREGHPDFHHPGLSTATLGMVQPYLDNENKPMVGTEDFYSSHLSEWYRTIDGTNLEFNHEIQLTDQGDGTFVYDDNQFFPMDRYIGFGMDIENYPDHNYLFTSEFNLKFLYEPNQEFTFKGDDDLWVFINGVLAIDVGGIHSPVEATVNIDNFNANTMMGMQYGQKYPMHIFHAERNPTQSNFKITTSIGCFSTVII
jgi:fibro-slime domain-containing protein